MPNNCLDGVYNIQYTDKTKNPITVNRKAYIQNIVDIVLLGKSRKEYGQILNENILHILENFASNEVSSIPNLPDQSKIIDNLLSHPTNGQTWYNIDRKNICVFHDNNWNPLLSKNDVSANSGVLMDGSSIPLPTDEESGYTFSYDECYWVVSPYSYPNAIEYMKCETDSNGVITSKFRPVGGSLESAYASYCIIGIKNI